MGLEHKKANKAFWHSQREIMENAQHYFLFYYILVEISSPRSCKQQHQSLQLLQLTVATHTTIATAVTPVLASATATAATEAGLNNNIFPNIWDSRFCH